MKYLSVCSGIEAATVAWHPLGWTPAAFSEIEPFPSSVLAHHYPSVPNLGDMTKFKEWPDYDIDVLVGGTPCQSFSVAGLRKGLADPRGNLMLTYLAIADRYQPQWLVWENVPGVLSSNGGKDFGTFLGGLAELGYGFAYRVLDAQYFGVPQRRRRVFVVGCLGDWRRAAAVLFERHSLQGHPAPRRNKGQEAAAGLVGGIDYEGNGHGGGMPTGPLLKGSPTGGGHPLPAVVYGIQANIINRKDHNGGNGMGFSADQAPTLTKADQHAVAYGTMCMATGQSGPKSGPTLNCNHEAPIAFNLRGRDGGAQLEVDPTGMANIRAASGGSSRTLVAFAQNQRDEVRMMHVAGALAAEPGAKQQTYIAFDCKASGQSGFGVGEIASTQRAMGHSNSHTNGGGHQAVMTGMQVRRLTPMECERLQGFPDFYTQVTHRRKVAADGPRYKALGNSMAVPVMHWIGSRIQMIESITQELEIARTA